MRKIKFRGKFVYANPDGSLKWVYGDFGHSVVPGKAVINEIIPYNEGDFIAHTEVLIGTVGQFTGIIDRNGVEIYEGDIIQTYDSNGKPILHEVYYFESEARFATKIGYENLNEGSLTQKWINELDFEVIGNIFDNPELLQK